MKMRRTYMTTIHLTNRGWNFYSWNRLNWIECIWESQCVLNGHMSICVSSLASANIAIVSCVLNFMTTTAVWIFWWVIKTKWVYVGQQYKKNNNNDDCLSRYDGSALAYHDLFFDLLGFVCGVFVTLSIQR